ncbi:rab-GTPase-TBC domain-containing protein [Cokeromyces recurvatus]|uniref:rab-GTPase-TBC domain-containing protein n=1 Tax=Cokeromyces recurvatus TaxID=90255 RepID=UPI002220DA8D|nr:rab-GTPase-TBC domain-containing protein [Cokeromyces recurvatus]KAI7899192.1 rab-GTPase-TBC domain-containing protein [Cokeromyces recurvatus]
MSKLIDALHQQEKEYNHRPPIHLRSSKSTSIRHNLLSPTRTTSGSLRGGSTRRRTNSLTIAASKKDLKLLPRLEEENANLPPQDSIEFILAQIERQNAILDEDPKSVCIQSNQLKCTLSTIQHLASNEPEGGESIDWEFWTALTEDFSAVALKLPHLVSAKIRAGIPSKVRGVIWQAMSQSASLNLETVYGQLVAEHSPYERILQRDLARTFPGIDMFKQEGGTGQQSLERVLKAYSLYDSLMPEQQAFCVFVRIMETYEMRSMFTLNMEGLQLRLYQFSNLLDQILPDLSNFLRVHEVNVPMYASQWFLTLFAYAFPMELIMRIYDIVFAEGAAETIMRVAIAMLKRSQATIMQLNEFEDILDFLSTKLYEAYHHDPGQVISDAVSLSGLITKEKMDHIAETYVAELEQEQKQTEQVLAVRFNFWSNNKSNNHSRAANRKKKTMSWYSVPKKSTDSDRSSIQLREPDVSQLHHQIEDLLSALSQMQRETIELKDDLMQTRLEKMDVEAERDALKMTIKTFHRHEEDATPLTRENRKLKQENEDLQQQLVMSKDALTALVERMLDMKNKVDLLEQDNLKWKHECQKLENDKKKLKQQLSVFVVSSSSNSNSSSSNSSSSNSSSNSSTSNRHSFARLRIVSLAFKILASRFKRSLTRSSSVIEFSSREVDDMTDRCAFSRSSSKICLNFKYLS